MAKTPKKKQEAIVLSEMPPSTSALVLNGDLVVDEPETEIETFAKSVLRELNGNKSTINRLAFEADPLQHNIYAGVYKQRLRLLPPYVIKRIAIQDDLVASIVLVRQNQMSAFGIPRPDRFSNGFTIEPKLRVLEQIEKEEPEAKIQRKQELQRRIAETTKVLLNCGYTDGIPDSDRLSFTQYLSQSTRNAVLMGMISTEIMWRDLPNGNKKFHAFRVIDAGTVYRAAPKSSALENVRSSALAALARIKNERLRPEKFESGEYAWVQVIDGRPVQAFTDQECLVHMFYPVPDVEMDGYPITPLDTAISAVTTHINIVTHNKLYFQYGRASHGMLILQSQDADERVLRTIKQQFNACLVASTLVSTKEYGQSSIETILNGSKEQKVNIWTGKQWNEALVYETGMRKLTHTGFNNGTTLSTSPDHKFLILGKDGLVWKEQKDLQIGDYASLNSSEVADLSNVPMYKGKIVTPEVMEVLGWLTGDGNLTQKGDHQRNVNSFRLYYHHEKEPAVLQRHLDTLNSFGVDASPYRREISIEEAEAIKERYGFNNVATHRIGIDSYDAEFVNWLISLGFTSSKMGKSIPARLHTLPTSLKSSFLKGFFSADGNNHLGKDPIITIANDSLRAQTKQLLLSLGIRTAPKEGISTGRFGTEKKATSLKIKDRKKFFDLVGFIQPHKQPTQNFEKSTHGRSDRIPFETLCSLTRQLLEHDSTHRHLRKSHRDKLNAIICGSMGCSRTHLLRLMDEAKFTAPSWLTEYHFEPIVFIERTDTEVKMFDVEVYDNEHRFVANGVVTHNSINSASNSFRMPVFAIGMEDKLSWQAIDTQGKDAEFQYLTDMNARVIMTAFMMSPDELPGWSYLSKGTASQSLAEGKNEYVMEAGRDVGIRPLIRHFEDFLNSKIFPLIDPVLAEMCEIKLTGLDADTAEKEAVRLQQDMQVYLTMDEVLEKVDKKAVGKAWGGEFFFNPAYQSILDKYFTVGECKEYFFGHTGAAKDPRYDYLPNAFYMQQMQLIQTDKQMEQAQQQAEQQAPGGEAPPEGGTESEETSDEPSEEESKPLLGDKIKQAESSLPKDK